MGLVGIASDQRWAVPEVSAMPVSLMLPRRATTLAFPQLKPNSATGTREGRCKSHQRNKWVQEKLDGPFSS